MFIGIFQNKNKSSLSDVVGYCENGAKRWCCLTAAGSSSTPQFVFGQTYTAKQRVESKSNEQLSQNLLNEQLSQKLSMKKLVEQKRN